MSNRIHATDREAIADYIAALTGDLAAIARRHGFDTLGYILDMAHLEAKIQLPPDKTPNVTRPRTPAGS
jgi:hypothetical protein